MNSPVTAFLIEVTIFFVLLLSPIPTTPYLLLTFATNELLVAGSTYILASTLLVFALYTLGYFIDIDKTFNLMDKVLPSIFKSKLVHQIKKFTLTNLKELSLRDNFGLRLAGVPTQLLILGVGISRGNLIYLLVPNTVYAIYDIMFYWVLVGSGKWVIGQFSEYTNIVSEETLETSFFALWLLLLISYLVFGSIKLKKYLNEN